MQTEQSGAQFHPNSLSSLTLLDYSFRRKNQVNFKCRQDNVWISSTLTLQGNGILHNASTRHVTGEDFICTQKQLDSEYQPSNTGTA
jgi:hypothetical protein